MVKAWEEKLKKRQGGGEKVGRPLAEDKGKFSIEKSFKKLISLFGSFPGKNKYI